MTPGRPENAEEPTRRQGFFYFYFLSNINLGYPMALTALCDVIKCCFTKTHSQGSDQGKKRINFKVCRQAKDASWLKNDQLREFCSIHNLAAVLIDFPKLDHLHQWSIIAQTDALGG